MNKSLLFIILASVKGAYVAAGGSAEWTEMKQKERTVFHHQCQQSHTRKKLIRGSTVLAFMFLVVYENVMKGKPEMGKCFSLRSLGFAVLRQDEGKRYDKMKPRWDYSETALLIDVVRCV